MLATPFEVSWKRFRTTGGVVHGVMSLENTVATHETLCGIKTAAVLFCGTGDWTHGQDPLTCIGCIAVTNWRPD